MHRNRSRSLLLPALAICLILPSRADGRGALYRLDSGDVLAVIVDGVLGDFASAPVHMPRSGDGTLPAIGYPTPVLRDGTVALPIIAPVFVRGLSVTDAKKKVAKAYRDQQILNEDNRVSMTLMRKRTINVTVVHNAGNASAAQAKQVRLPADRSNVLGALVESKSFDPRATIYVHSRSGRLQTHSGGSLREGDIVQLNSRPSGHFYSGGRLAGGAHALPSSPRPNALQGVAIAGGMPPSRLFGSNQVMVIPYRSQPIVVSYPQLLNNPSAVPIRPGDTIIAR